MEHAAPGTASATVVAPALPAPIGLLAELTHRCPLKCPYCSNPLELERRAGELDTATWKRVLSEAAALGVLQVHLSGGEPTARRDIVEITRHCAETGLYSNLITSGVGLRPGLLEALSDAGLDHVQLSVQAADAAVADDIGGLAGAHATKLAFAEKVVALGLPLTLNAVIHRANIASIGDLVELALRMGAKRLEIAHVQYYGWAFANRAALMPGREAVVAAMAVVEDARVRLKGRLVIDAVLPDYYARYPKACVGGWGRRSINVSPTGKVLPCHAAETIPDLVFWSVREHALAEIWARSPAFEAFRGTGWMKEPCRTCERREIDFGGCRCQALAFAGDAAATDPACHRSPLHAQMVAIAEADARAEAPYRYRGYSSMPA
jgi:pyrroloquinoline quinone biosynthesis protein E